MTVEVRHRTQLAAPALDQRITAIDADALALALDRDGFSTLPKLLTTRECEDVRALYERADVFRSRVVMSRHGFGRGEYQYFAPPLPDLVQTLRERCYPLLAPIANRWNERMKRERRFPDTLAALSADCAALGQTRPTPLLLKYGPDDYNCLHRDLYGALVFPLQLAVLLSAPEREFDGGELVLTEQRPRMQSKVSVVPLAQGDAVVFAVAERPVAGTRGDYRVGMRHGVSAVRCGARYTLGVIFHDAE
jgi:hypothetical protein